MSPDTTPGPESRAASDPRSLALKLEPGLPVPMGAHVQEASGRTGGGQAGGQAGRGSGVNFALFSAHATKVELCLFDAAGTEEIARLELPRRSGDVWHGWLEGAGEGLVYGYRVHGPWQPEAGHRFNPHKLLVDPCARALLGEVVWNDAVYAYERGHPDADLSFDRRDSAPFVPKSVVRERHSRRRTVPRPHVPRERSIVYETHVSSFTRHFPGLEARRRGTYAALGSRAVLRYLAGLGITAVELLPVHAFVDDHFLVEDGLVNHWGYNTLAFMAPMARYAMGEPVAEFRDMVRALHGAGLECWLDVVYNHTCEGNELGPTLSLRGIDNLSYYRLAEDRRYYVNDSGCGNTLALEHPRVLQLVMDSLRFWVDEMGVDGFRFDLASILGREAHGFDPGAGFFDAIAQDPVLARTRLVAEPWDIGPGGYQLGGYPLGWSEWNDRFRDVARRFWVRGEPLLPELAASLLGSGGTFEAGRRAPQASLNFITAHDGFTLEDLVSHDHKHNEANGEANRDGHGDNHSWNHGVEGATSDPEVRAARDRCKRNLLATTLLSQGVPMLLAGDELGHSQGGNNNAYCHDDDTTWIDWRPRRIDADLQSCVRRLTALRASLPVLSRTRWLHGQRVEPRGGLPDVSWLDARGEPMEHAGWHADEARFVAMQLLGDACEPGDAPSDSVLVLVNGGDAAVDFPLQGTAVAPGPWWPVLDTATSDGAPAGYPDEGDGPDERDGGDGAHRTRVRVAPRSVRAARCYNGRTATIR